MNIHVLDKMKSQDAFWTDLGAIWAPKSSQMGGQKGPKRHQKRDQNDIKILIDFWTDFEAILEAQEIGCELGGGLRVARLYCQILTRNLKTV